MSHLSFRELSALGSALILAVVAALYLPDALMLASGSEMREMLPDGNWRTMNKSGHLLGVAFGAVVLIVVLQIIVQATLAAIRSQEANEPQDERDRLVDLKASRVAYILLNLGAVALLVHIFWRELSVPLIAVWLVALLYATDITKYFATFVYYRTLV